MSNNHDSQHEQKGYAIVKSPMRRLTDEFGMRTVSHVGSVLARVFPDQSGLNFGGLMYHRMCDPVAGVSAPSMNVPPKKFRSQLLGLKKAGIRFWSLSRLLDYRSEGKTLPRGVCTVTFDDGYENFYHHAWPVLKDLDIPATLFLATSFVDTADPFHFDHWAIDNRDRLPAVAYVPLKMEQCQEMHSEGLSIGAHTHTHQDFRGRADEFELDLQVSVDIVKNAFPGERMLFAFPYGTPSLGFADPDLIAAARACGTDCGLNTGSELNALNSDPFTWGRYNAFPWDTAGTLLSKLRGWYSWAPRLRAALQRSGKQNARDSR